MNWRFRRNRADNWTDSSANGVSDPGSLRSYTPGSGKRVAGLSIPVWLPLGGLLLLTAAETGRIDGPHREIFFNINNFWVLYALLPLVGSVIVYGLARRYRVWALGKHTFSFNNRRSRLRQLFFGGFGTQRVFKDRYSGFMHLAIMSSMVVLFLVTALLAIDDYLPNDKVMILVGDRYLGYSLVADVFGLIGLIGVGMAIAHPWLRPRITWITNWEDKVIIFGLAILLVTGFLVEGLRIQTSEIHLHPNWSVWSPIGFVVAKGFSAVDTSDLLVLHRVIWWFHMIAALSWISLIGFTKLNHLIGAPVNAFLKSTEPSGKLSMIPNIEEQDNFGVSQLEHFTMKQLFELDVCVSCGRCTDSCPADIAGQPLSPMHLIQDLKAHAQEVGDRKVANRMRGLPINAGLENTPTMLGEVIRDESLWACRTCGACVEECPVFIEHVPTIVDMRRALVMEEARMPDSVRSALETLERQGHPWRGSPHTRESWMEGLNVPIWSGEQEYLYYVGCTGALVDQVQTITKSVVKLLQQADVSFGVLGGQETCNGDPARRLGNEYLFEVLAKGLIQSLGDFGVKKIITHCPHCFNTFKNEYPDFGGTYEVLHHSELLEKLVDSGKLVPVNGDAKTVTFHDSCYLGRHNNLFDAPRNVLKKIPNVTLVEMPRNREQGLCCGAGGGNMWMEERGGERVNEIRVKEAIETGAESACTVCPFCVQMFDSGIETVEIDRNDDERFKVFDISEYLESSLVDSNDLDK